MVKRLKQFEVISNRFCGLNVCGLVNMFPTTRAVFMYYLSAFAKLVVFNLIKMLRLKLKGFVAIWTFLARLVKRFNQVINQESDTKSACFPRDYRVKSGYQIFHNRILSRGF